jgi:CHAD domain-containing protein
MLNEQFQFLVPEGTDLNSLKSKLQKVLGLSEVSSRVVEHTYFDTFDWRINQVGTVLEKISCDGESLLTWRPLNSVSARASEIIKGTPKFAHDLPTGRLRNELEKILEMRAFMPQARVRTRVRTFGLLNKEKKTVLRLAVEQHALQSSKRSRPRQLGSWIQVLPVKGYDKPVKKAVSFLTQEMGLEVASDDLMLAALAAESRQPEYYSSKLKLHLEPDMRTDAAVRTILSRLLEIIEINEEGTRKDIDSEFLHDFRVAVRKTRSALTQVKGVFPQRVLDKYRTGFAWLGSVTGPTRDMDVYLLNFDHYRLSLPESIQDKLGPLHDFLIAHHKKEQAILVKVLNSAKYRNLLKGWQAVLQSALPARSTLPNATRPVIVVADERIMKAYKRVIKEGMAITPESHAERLHDLRKSCKKLRYLMEFFQSLYPAAKITALIGVLKSLQENLGDFQDFEVQATCLKSFSHQMIEEGEVPPETLMAMGVLVDGLENRQHQAREEFARRFNKFSLAKNQDRFHELFRVPDANRETKL